MDFPENFLRKWMQTGGEKPKTVQQVEEEFPTFKTNSLDPDQRQDRKGKQPEVNPEELATI